MSNVSPQLPQLDCYERVYDDLQCLVQISSFASGAVDDVHLTVHPNVEDDFGGQLDGLLEGYARACAEFQLSPDTCLWQRWFLSDPANQIDGLRAAGLGADGCAVSFIGQAPLRGNKLVLLSQHVRTRVPLMKESNAGVLELQRGAQTHLWQTGLGEDVTADAATQTRQIFKQYGASLASLGGDLLSSAVRTWIYVRGIDMNYAGMVQARMDLFADAGLTPETHYIASTGIEARFPNQNGKVQMDTYSIAGLAPGQVEHLNAFDHLGRTDDYGVNFERATAIHYLDRSHVFISGTASINPAGDILHEGDVAAQFERALENVAALLAQTGGTLDAMAHWIIYLRDPADAQRIQRLARERLGGRPHVVVVGAVCRPGWLVEIEGLAILAAEHLDLPDY